MTCLHAAMRQVGFIVHRRAIDMHLRERVSSCARGSQNTYSSRFNAPGDIQCLLVISCPDGRGQSSFVVVRDPNGIFSILCSNDNERRTKGF